MKEKLRNKKGITLIALVITIIVLLILAGVTIATLTGENGILTKATESKERTTQATAEEMPYETITDSEIYYNPDVLTAMGLTLPEDITAEAIDVIAE